MVAATHVGFDSYQDLLTTPLPAQIEIVLSSDASTTQGTSTPADSPAQAPQEPPTPSQQAATPASLDDLAGWSELLWDLLWIILYFGAPSIVLILCRWLTVRLALLYMMHRAPRTIPLMTHLEQVSSELPRTGVPSLDFLNVNTANGILLNGASQERYARMEQTAKKLLSVTILSVLAGLAAFLLLTVCTAVFYPTQRPELAAIGVVLLIYCGMLMVPSIWYLSNRSLPALLSVILVLISAALAPAAVYGGLLTLWLVGLPVVSQAYVLWWLLPRVRRPALADGNRRLLILRVFGSDSAAAFTFGSIMSKWRFAGSFLTIVDPSYLRYQFGAFNPFKRMRPLNLLLWYMAPLVGVIAAWAVLFVFPQLLPASWRLLPPQEMSTRLANIGLLLVSPFAVVPILMYVRSRFVESVEEVSRRIGRSVEVRQRPNLGGAFKGYSMVRTGYIGNTVDRIHG